MLDQSDIQYIINDLEAALRTSERAEAYEQCTYIKGILHLLNEHLHNDAPYQSIVHALFEVCVARYVLFRLLQDGSQRYAVFLIPNQNMVSFLVPNNDDDSPSPLWCQLIEEEKMITDKIRRSITEE